MISELDKSTVLKVSAMDLRLASYTKWDAQGLFLTKDEVVFWMKAGSMRFVLKIVTIKNRDCRWKPLELSSIKKKANGTTLELKKL